MIATAFHDICDNELISELMELWEQTPTRESNRTARLIQQELGRRQDRRQLLEDNFAWG